MKVNIREIIAGQKSKIAIEANENMDDISYFGDDIKFITPVTLKAEVSREEDEIFIKGIINGMAEFNCARCLKKFQKEIDEKLDAQLVFSENDDDEIEDTYPIEEDRIDISDIIYNTLVLSLPMKIICSKNCKGLCAVCGKNLNVDTCSCKIDEIDPRLAKLKDLLHQD